MIDAQRIASAPLGAFDGSAYRHQSPQYDPLDGHGARLNGGRFTPPGSFPTLYLCTTVPCAAAELVRLGQRQVIGVDALLPRVLYEYSVELSRVLDLSSQAVLDAIGLRRSDVTGSDWGPTQELGAMAHALGLQAIRSPSALGVDEVIAIFPTQLADGRLEPRLRARWDQPSDLPS